MFKRLISNIASLISFFIALISLFCLFCIHLDLGGPAFRGLVGVCYQVLMLINLIFLVFWITKSSKRALFHIIVLAASFSLLPRFYHLNFKETKPNGTAFSVLSYNVLFVDNVRYIHENKKQNAEKLSAAMLTNPSDIKCFQEFYNYGSIETFNLYPKFAKTHPFKCIAQDKIQVGLAIFSKYPILKQKHIKFDYSNGILWADIEIKGRICRVFNVQLNSMGIRLGKLATTKQDKAEHEARIVASKLTEGFDKRQREIGVLMKEIEQCPYPIILCGDLNEVPFGRSYSRISQKLNNSFEAKGSGFGLTLNRLPYLVRIDNQFFSKDFEALSFKTMRQINFSDHFPIKGIYQWK